MANNKLSGAHVTDVDDLTTFSERKIYKKESRLHQIRKIHYKSSDTDEKDYEPSHISIGPYYRGYPALHAMEKEKWGYLSYFLELNHEKNLHDYIEGINGLEKQARNFYGNEIKMDRKSFVEMLLLDACFILRTLNVIDEIAPELKIQVKGSEIMMDDENNDQIVIVVDENRQINEANEWHANGDEDNSYSIYDRLRIKFLIHDALLLGNQIPFFVITKVYQIVTGNRSISLLVRNIVQSLKYIFQCHPEEIHMSDPAKEIYHLLHLCHMYLKPNRREEEMCQNHVTRSVSFKKVHHLGANVFKDVRKKLSHDHGYETPAVRRVTQYHEATMELKKREFFSDTSYSLLDIRFINDTLEIPYLSIDQKTFNLLKNLIAFEQTCHQSCNYVTSYVLFWSQFVTAPDDVSLLVEKGIIKHGLPRDNEVVDQFRTLTEFIAFDLNADNYLASLCQIMEAHYQTRRPKWRELFTALKSKVLRWTHGSTSELPIYH